MSRYPDWLTWLEQCRAAAAEAHCSPRTERAWLRARYMRMAAFPVSPLMARTMAKELFAMRLAEMEAEA